ncbi:MAG: hypothetical protein CMJ79_01960 [Planctomycetaceae bacterium]|nr:hypothetical protein [Planctomycetaceae bacterium]|tara:strand:+ start:6447 stop:6878 length:432 start_codon:yes stop_codon:yes gene_type:complete
MGLSVKQFSKPLLIVWIMAYIGLISAIVVNMQQARERVVDAPDQVRQKDQSDWEAWVNKSNQHQDGQLPVERKEIDLKYRPVSNMTTLLTQYYGVCLTGLIVFSTLIFGAVVYMFHGVTGAKAAGPITLEQELAGMQSGEERN